MADKLQQEIDEILSQLDRVSAQRPIWVRVPAALAAGFRRLVANVTGFRFPAFSISQLLLLSLLAVIIGYVFFAAENTVGRVLLFGGIGGFALALVLSLRRSGHRSYTEKHWRGQPLEVRGQGRIRSWWGRWRGRR